MTNYQIGLSIIFYIAWIYINVLVSDAKDLNIATTIFLSILLTPFMGYLYVLGMPDRSNK